MKRVLTPEVKQMLLSKSPFSKSSTVEYTPKAYLEKTEAGEYVIPEEFRPVFTLRPFTKTEAVEVKKACVKADEIVIKEWSRKVCTNWVNLFDSGTGEEIEYVADPITGADKEIWSTIPDHIAGDILMYVTCISGILDKDKVGL